MQRSYLTFTLACGAFLAAPFAAAFVTGHFCNWNMDQISVASVGFMVLAFVVGFPVFMFLMDRKA